MHSEAFLQEDFHQERGGGPLTITLQSPVPIVVHRVRAELCSDPKTRIRAIWTGQKSRIYDARTTVAAARPQSPTTVSADDGIHLTPPLVLPAHVPLHVELESPNNDYSRVRVRADGFVDEPPPGAPREFDVVSFPHLQYLDLTDLTDDDEDADAQALRRAQALQIAFRYGQIPGDHHRTWVIDQMVRALLSADGYAQFRKEYTGAGEDPENPIDVWDEGVTP